jgi:DNA-binding PadR family transcriptional regulator
MHRFFRHLHDFHGGRHGRRHHHGFFGFGADSGFGQGRGAGHFGPGRKLGSADLQLLLLALLAEKASYGYELIKALDERSHGYYSPSPGMIYPALTYLEEIGHATVQAEGAKKLYSITETGLTHLEQNRAAVDTLLEQLTWIGHRMDHLKRAMSWHESGEDESDSDHADKREEFRRGFSSDVRMARRKLKSALIEKIGVDADEQKRIAGILERAAAEIRGS